MADNPLYIPLFTIEEVILDKDTGLPLSGGVVKFFRDSQRFQPKSVYQISGTSPNYTYIDVGNEFVLSIAGTFVDGSGDPFVPYAYPYDAQGEVDKYYVTVESEGGVSQFTRENVPYIPEGGVTPSERTSTVNELSNPQFVDVLFDTVPSSYIYNVSGTNTVTPVAPDWDFVTTGTGTIEVIWDKPVSLASPSNPPYALSILASAGLGSTIVLRQRITNSPRLGANSFASGSFVAAVVGGGATAASMAYVPSTGTSTTMIASTDVPTDGEFHTLQGNAFITPENTDPATTGYVDINITLPTQRTVKISSVQLVIVPDAVNIPFDQLSTPRQIDQLFHYFKPQLEYKPIPSYLVGWDFPLNPAQFSGRTVGASAIGANKSKYVWDQTIIFQSANSGVGVSGGSSGALVLTAAATTQMAIIQYLPSTIARQILNDRIAVHVRAKASVAANATISLWYTTDASLPNAATGTNNSLVLTLGTNGKPATFNGNWTEVPRGALGDAIFEIETNATTNFNDYAFSGWDLEGAAAANTATFFAIIIGTASIATPQTVSFDSVGLCSGDIATRPAPLTLSETLENCQYYYEKSYENGVFAGNASATNQLIEPQRVAAAGTKTASFDVPYRTLKRTTPTFSPYSPNSSAAGIVLAVLYNNGAAVVQSAANISAWSVVAAGTKGINFAANGDTTIAAGTGNEGFIAFQYVADARLGIV